LKSPDSEKQMKANDSNFAFFYLLLLSFVLPPKPNSWRAGSLGLERDAALAASNRWAFQAVRLRAAFWEEIGG
jgi:hypothetical protein